MYQTGLSIALLAATVAVLVALFGPTWQVYGQTIVVGPDDVTTPHPEGSSAQGTPATLTVTPTVTPQFVMQDDVAYGRGEAAYVVKEGDTLLTVALEIGLDLDAMPCLIRPNFRLDLPLVIGDALYPPAGEMICHQVVPGDTPATIAAAHGVDADRIILDSWNELDAGAGLGQRLEPGRYVRILLDRASAAAPGFFAYLLDRPIAEPPMLAYALGGRTRRPNPALVPADWPYGSGYFEWPSYGWITQGYRNDHRAIDIAAPAGTTVTASDRGVVVRAGWNDQGYGMFVVIDHNIDYITLYSHLQEILVEEGDIVAQGQELGTVGSTGNSTGPHLHFEVRDFGARINPLEVLLR